MQSVTNQVSTTDDSMYLITGNGEEMFLVDNRDEALLVLDSLASHDVKIYEKRRDYKVFRQDLNNGEKIVVSTQTTGLLYDGPPKVKVTFEMKKLAVAVLTSSRKPIIKRETLEYVDVVRKRSDVVEIVDV